MSATVSEPEVQNGGAEHPPSEPPKSPPDDIRCKVQQMVAAFGVRLSLRHWIGVQVMAALSKEPQPSPDQLEKYVYRVLEQWAKLPDELTEEDLKQLLKLLHPVAAEPGGDVPTAQVGQKSLTPVVYHETPDAVVFPDVDRDGNVEKRTLNLGQGTDETAAPSCPRTGQPSSRTREQLRTSDRLCSALQTGVTRTDPGECVATADGVELPLGILREMARTFARGSVAVQALVLATRLADDLRDMYAVLTERRQFGLLSELGVMTETIHDIYRPAEVLKRVTANHTAAGEATASMQAKRWEFLNQLYRRKALETLLAAAHDPRVQTVEQFADTLARRRRSGERFYLPGGRSVVVPVNSLFTDAYLKSITKTDKRAAGRQRKEVENPDSPEGTAEFDPPAALTPPHGTSRRWFLRRAEAAWAAAFSDHLERWHGSLEQRTGRPAKLSPRRRVRQLVSCGVHLFLQVGVRQLRLESRNARVTNDEVIRVTAELERVVGNSPAMPLFPLPPEITITPELVREHLSEAAPPIVAAVLVELIGVRPDEVRGHAGRIASDIRSGALPVQQTAARQRSVESLRDGVITMAEEYLRSMNDSRLPTEEDTK